MAILSVKERHYQDGHAATFDQRGIAVTRAFVVQSDDLADWPMEIPEATDPTTALRIPRIGEQHPESPLLRVRTVVPTPIGSGDVLAYNVAVNYDTRTDFAGFTDPGAVFTSNTIQPVITPDNTTFIDDPTERPWSARFVTQREPGIVKRVTLVSDDGGQNWSPADAVVNTAGQTFDPEPTEDQLYSVLEVSRNVESFASAIATAYTDAVNSDFFFGYPPRQVKLVEWTADAFFESNKWYWRERYEFWLKNPGTWDLEVLNAGLCEVDDTVVGTGEVYLKPIKDPTGSEISQPMRLDLNGKPLDLNAPSIYRRFRNESKELPFESLGLNL